MAPKKKIVKKLEFRLRANDDDEDDPTNKDSDVPEEKSSDNSKPSTSKSKSETIDASIEPSEDEEQEPSPVDQWLDKIINATPFEERDTTRVSAMTVPERGKKSRVSAMGGQHKRISSYTEAPDSSMIRRKLSFLLPSYTIVRAQRASTITEDALDEREPTPPRKSTRFDRYPSGASRQSLLGRAKEYSTFRATQSAVSAEIAIEGFSVECTDKERLKQLASIRGLAVPMKEKKQIRDSIIQKMNQPRIESMWMANQQQVKTRYKHFMKILSSRTDIWSGTMKRIEGRLGTGVVSYFVFLRFLLFLNLFIFVLFTLFLVIPAAVSDTVPHKRLKLAPNISIFEDSYEKYFKTPNEVVLSSRPTAKPGSYDFPSGIGVEDLGSLLDSYMFPELVDVALHHNKANYSGEERLNISRYCSAVYDVLVKNETIYTVVNVIQDFLQGTGWMEQTLLFIGHYRSEDVLFFGYNYNMSLAFLSLLITILIVSVFMMIEFSSKGSREALLATTGSIDTFSNILFSSWDYCIEDTKTATAKHNSITHEMQSTLSEKRRQEELRKWSPAYRARIVINRLIVNLVVIGMLCIAYYAIYAAAVFQMKKYQERKLNKTGFHVLLVQFLCPFIIMFFNFLMLFVFPFLTKFEKYHAETVANITLARYLFLRLTSLIVLVSSFYYEITCHPQNMCGLGTSAECPSPMCWETYVGQQIYKLVLMDLFIYIAITFCWDVPYAFVLDRWKDRMPGFLGKQIFDIPSQVLALLYSQTLGWLGMFYSPLLPVVNVLKIILIFHLKKRSCKAFIPNPVPHKASRSNNIFVFTLFVTFFFVLFVLGYSISNLEPSPGCSPFRIYLSMMEAIPEATEEWSKPLSAFFRFLFSGVFYVPASILLCLAIYYYLTIESAHKRMADILKEQLALEGRDKEYLLNRITEAAKLSI